MEYFIINRDDNKLSYKKSEDYIKNKTIFRKYSNLSKKIDKRDRKDKFLYDIFYIFPTRIIFTMLNSGGAASLQILNNCEDIYYKIFDLDINYNKRQTKKFKEGDEKFDNIIGTGFSEKIYKNVKNWNKEKMEGFLLKYNILKFCALFEILNKGGSYIFDIINYCCNSTIDLLYLCLILFKSVTIYFGRYIYCNNFDPLISKNEVSKLLDKSYIITPKNKLDELEKYLQKTFTYNVEILNYYNDGKYEILDNIYYNEYINYINKISSFIDDKNYMKDIMIDFKKFYLTLPKHPKVYNENSKKLIKIKAGIGNPESKYLEKILKSKNLKKCMEIGLAFGVSALTILGAIYKRGGTLVSIDPNQSKKDKWNNMGKKLIENAGLGKYHTIIEDKSYNAMPELLKKEAGTFDFIFIDGWHTFDYTLIDFFYADKLLKIGGFIVIDDALHRGVEKNIKIY